MKLFVWDFHGTLEKGNDFAVAVITNLILKQHGFSRELSLEEAEMLSGSRWYEYFVYLLPEESLDVCMKLQADCVSYSQNNPDIIAKHIVLNEHALDVLNIVHQSHHHQIILSNTQPKTLDIFIETVGIAHYFPKEHRIGVDSHCQVNKTKKDYLNHFLANKQYVGGIVTIGDSAGDMSLVECHSKAVGYLYTYPERKHRSASCHYKINNLRDVLQEI